MNRKSSEAPTESYISQEDVSPFIKAHRSRWIVLLLFVIISTISTFQWFQYTSISDAVTKYYETGDDAVDWTAKVFVIVWPILVLPASFIIEKQGLRVAALIGCIAMTVGAVIKAFSVDKNLFYVVMIGQSTSSISQVFIVSLPPKIAASWFPPNEISTASSIGFFGMVLGRSLGQIIPPSVVNSSKLEKTSSELYTLCSAVAAVSLFMAFIIFLYFPKRPNHSPSRAQLEARMEQKYVTISHFASCLKALVTNRPFLIHTMAYGICLAIFFATEFILNKFTQGYFKNMEINSPRTSLVVFVFELLSPILTGLILDKTRKYKKMALMIYFLSILSMGGILISFHFKVNWMMYTNIIILGFLTNAYMVAGTEFAMELTYPSLESTPTGILIATSQIFGVVFTLFLATMNSKFGSVWALATQVALLLIGALFTYWIPNNLVRQEAFYENVLFEKVAQVE